MKLNITSPKLDVVLTDDAGNVVAQFHATEYHASFDTIALLNAITEHAPSFEQLVVAFKL